jgi:type I restriction enzyme, S subunit
MREGWVSDRLSNCIKLKSGDGLTAKKMIPGNFPVFGGNGVAGYHNDFNLSGENIIVGRVGALCGNARYTNQNIWLTDNAFKISEFKYELDLKFINYLLNFLDLRSFARQAAQPVISNSSLKDVILTFPNSLSEQKQIVSILDKAFAAIDQAKANIEKNLANAKELFQSKLNEIFSQKGEGWEEKKVIELCDHKSQIVGGPFGSNLKVSDYKESGIPILRLQNIGKGYFIDKAIKYVSAVKAKELAYHSFESGDIVLAKLGIPIGKTCIVPDNFEYGIVVADVVRISPNKKAVDFNFLKHFLNSDLAVNQLSADIKGATRPRVNIAEVRNLKLSVPSFTDQVNITDLIDTIESLRNSQLGKYSRKIESLEELKKSILQKAFAGELTQKEAVPA